jgi:hypothetical protein
MVQGIDRSVGPDCNCKKNDGSRLTDWFLTMVQLFLGGSVVVDGKITKFVVGST